MPATLTAGLVTMAAEHAESLARRARWPRPFRPNRWAGRWRSWPRLAAAIGLLALAMPDLVKTEWNRFRRPTADVPPYSPLRFTVTPGDTSVLYGEDLEIGATVDGGVADHLELVLEDSDGSQSSLPMFSEAGGTWRAVLSKLTEPTKYFVRCYRARSEKYAIDIITVPRIETVRVLVVPPEYAGQPNYEGPVPDEGVKGLRGTKVTVWATSNRPLSGGKLLVTRGHAERAGKYRRTGHAAHRSRAARRPSASSRSQADGKFEFRVIDDAGQPSQQSFSGNVTLVKDQYPLVRILRPPPQSLATPTAVLPVVLSAEDDCGISRLELFRSLNHSRPLPGAGAIAAEGPASPRRADPLAAGRLRPGAGRRAHVLRAGGRQRSGRGQRERKPGGQREDHFPGGIRAHAPRAARGRGPGLEVSPGPAAPGRPGQGSRGLAQEAGKGPCQQPAGRGDAKRAPPPATAHAAGSRVAAQVGGAPLAFRHRRQALARDRQGRGNDREDGRGIGEAGETTRPA